MRSPRGFSLLEVLVAGALFSLGTAGVLSSWATLSGLVDTEERRGDAVLIAEDVLDRLRLLPRGAPDLAVGSHDRFFGRDLTPVGVADPAGYVVNWVITPVFDGATFVRVDLEVAWRGLDGRTHLIEFLTFRAS